LSLCSFLYEGRTVQQKIGKAIDSLILKTTIKEAPMTSSHHDAIPTLDSVLADQEGIALPLSFIKSTAAVSSSLSFLPDFTEHPKPKKKKPRKVATEQEEKPAARRLPAEDGDEGSEDITFFHDFVAGGVAGSASVVVGHPFDT